MLKVSFEGSVKKRGQTKYQMAKEFRSFARKDLAKECRRVFDIANKRINRLEAAQVLSPALHAVNKSGGKFYVKGKDLKQLQHEYARCVNFLNMGTSTVTKARQHERTIESKIGHKLSTEQKKTLFEAYRAIERHTPAGVQSYGSDRLIQYLADEIESEDENIYNGQGSQDWDAMIEKTIQQVNEEYEAIEQQFTDAFTDIFSS